MTSLGPGDLAGDVISHNNLLGLDCVNMSSHQNLHHPPPLELHHHPHLQVSMGGLHSGSNFSIQDMDVGGADGPELRHPDHPGPGGDQAQSPKYISL